MEERLEESADEVLARLERYVESLRARPSVWAPERRATPSLVEAAVARPEAAVARPRAAVDTLIPTRGAAPPRPRRFVSEVAPALVAVAICSFVIVLSQWLGSAVAVVGVAALMLLGVVGLVRRIPLARAYTFGLVTAALLIRFS